jgi:hypothetical protein
MFYDYLEFAQTFNDLLPSVLLSPMLNIEVDLQSLFGLHVM